jgi:uncharacterized repeat protein (TIGR02543 family)
MKKIANTVIPVLCAVVILFACNHSGTDGNPSYRVTYDGNGSTSGSAPVDPAMYQQNQSVIVLGNTGSLAKNSHTFAGWNTKADGTGVTYSQGQVFTMGPADTTLYARWTQNPTWQVAYDGNGNAGGNAPVDTTNYEEGQTFTVLGNAGNLVKAGYNFAGWNTQADGTGTGYSVGQTLAMGTAQVTLYAVWTAVPVYAVLYDGNGAASGSPPVDPNQYETGQTVTVRLSNGIRRDNYTFAGWNTQANGSGAAYQYGQTFIMGAAPVTLYAMWKMHGQKETFTVTADSISFVMIKVPAKNYLGGTYDTEPKTMTNNYWLGETEVTYEFWSKVYVWATGDANMNGTIDAGETAGPYTFGNVGRQGGNFNSGPVGTAQHPVTTITRRDAMVWTNALTEWYNAKTGATYTCIYYSDAAHTAPLRDSSPGSYGSSIDTNPGSFDNPYINSSATGFRLPFADSTGNEWELAARYVVDNNGDGDIRDAGEYYPGVYASGAEASTQSAVASEATGFVAVFTSQTAAVKSRGPNSLGFYDMSGNVSELLFEPIGRGPFAYGGNWSGGTPPYVMIGSPSTVQPWYKLPYHGFRIARNDL